MKKIVVAVIVSCAFSLLAADSTNTVRRVRRPRRPSAGVLERPEAVPSRQIGVYSVQKRISAAAVETSVRLARRRSNLPLSLNAEKSPVRIEIVDSEAFGMLALYPEENRAQVNVRALAADNAPMETVETRLRTELARAALFVLGSGTVPYDCLTKPVRSLAELDALAKETPSAESLLHLGTGRVLGIGMIRYASYEAACREGWAPAPTNDIQKAIWDKVHAMPTAPIKIKPETKKVTE